MLVLSSSHAVTPSPHLPHPTTPTPTQHNTTHTRSSPVTMASPASFEPHQLAAYLQPPSVDQQLSYVVEHCNYILPQLASDTLRASANDRADPRPTFTCLPSSETLEAYLAQLTAAHQQTSDTTAQLESQLRAQLLDSLSSVQTLRNTLSSLPDDIASTEDKLLDLCQDLVIQVQLPPHPSPAGKASSPSWHASSSFTPPSTSSERPKTTLQSSLRPRTCVWRRSAATKTSRTRHALWSISPSSTLSCAGSTSSRPPGKTRTRLVEMSPNSSRSSVPSDRLRSRRFERRDARASPTPLLSPAGRILRRQSQPTPTLQPRIRQHQPAQSLSTARPCDRPGMTSVLSRIRPSISACSDELPPSRRPSRSPPPPTRCRGQRCLPAAAHHPVPGGTHAAPLPLPL